ncbi:hypothetical protein CYMTET_11901 [Cymbomonas tetramitiformis]|uniref:Uncharacterized protein n=1 Tax=Cymbomonas tetramitiformis TaxID=36881 RepID=A0AAE0GLD0_9CHLO|nr:hypothetical protein CYMTET_11901 [Cymbomonas tetramitiformis]
MGIPTVSPSYGGCTHHSWNRHGSGGSVDGEIYPAASIAEFDNQSFTDKIGFTVCEQEASPPSPPPLNMRVTERGELCVLDDGTDDDMPSDGEPPTQESVVR